MNLNTFVNTFLYYFKNIVLIHSIHYKFENEWNIRPKISSIIQYVNNITDMCWSLEGFKIPIGFEPIIKRNNKKFVKQYRGPNIHLGKDDEIKCLINDFVEKLIEM